MGGEELCVISGEVSDEEVRYQTGTERRGRHIRRQKGYDEEEGLVGVKCGYGLRVLAPGLGFH